MSKHRIIFYRKDIEKLPGTYKNSRSKNKDVFKRYGIKVSEHDENIGYFKISEEEFHKQVDERFIKHFHHPKHEWLIGYFDWENYEWNEWE